MKPQKSPGTAIIKSLTLEQTTTLLDAVFLSVSPAQSEKLLAALPADIARTVASILGSGTGADQSEPRQQLSSAKNLEIWHGLWRDWDAHLAELGDEKGRYAFQDRHWEPPYFDGRALAEDLEKIAEKMLPLVELIFQSEEEEPAVFAAAVEAIKDGIESFPEWMQGIEDAEFTFGPFATRCLLGWERLHAESVGDFLARMAALQDQWFCQLDDTAFREFFAGWAEKEKKEAFAWMSAHRNEPFWNEQLASPWSAWQQVYHELAARFSKEAYLEHYARLLDRNWRYGVPLLTEQMQGSDAEGAEKTIKRIFSVLLRRGGPKPIDWQPEKDLLLPRLGYSGVDSELRQVFEHWMSLAGAKGDTRLTAVLAFQLATCESPYDWDKMAALYGKLAKRDADGIQELYKQWAACQVANTVGQSNRLRGQDGECWLDWLLGSVTDKTRNDAWFRQRIQEWLEVTRMGKNLANSEEKAIIILSHDLFAISGQTGKYPQLCNVLGEGAYGRTTAVKARHVWLARSGADKLLPDILSFWRRNLEKYMPDPGRAAGAQYAIHAKWLAAAYELDRNLGGTILNRWRREHQRRRNLWKAIQDLGLPV